MAAITSIVAAVTIAVVNVARHRYEKHIVALANRDSLTGLPNRACFGEKLRAACRDAGRGSRFGLYLIDLDGFKAVNDSYGHPVGDQLLIAVAARLRAALPAADVLARLGGDEFAILHRSSDEDAGLVTAGQVARVFAEPFRIGDLDCAVAGSFGMAMIPDDSSEPDEAMRLADLALYEAKANLRGSLVTYRKSMNVKAQFRDHVKRGLAEALIDGGFVLHYQPIVDMATGRAEMFEALLRWRHPHLGPMSPGDFIPIAEESGQIVAIGCWVLAEACRAVARFPGEKRVSVNCSPRQLAGENFVPEVEAIIGALSSTRDDPVAILHAIVDLAKALRMKVVAEGVETLDEAMVLHRLGCENAQGYWFGRPEPVTKILS